MSAQVDTVVIGGGAMGSATAWQLARRGREVVLLERFGPGHKNGASHGASRNFNVSYPDPVHLGLLREALGRWRDLEVEAGVSVLDQIGVANHGRHPLYAAVAESLTAAGFGAEFLTPEAAGERWPGIRFDGQVLFTPDAGRLDADAAVAALQRAAAAHGADVLHGARVAAIEVLGDDEVRVEVEIGDGSAAEAGVGTTTEVITARRVVVAAGAWTEKLIGASVALPALVVTQEQPAHFAVRDESIEWPGFNHAPSAAEPAYDSWYSGVYGMFTPGEGVKAGWHGVGPVVDPDRRSFVPEPEQLAALQQYAADWLPGVDPGRFAAISCTYTTTPDSIFVLDRSGPVVVGAGFSGHGFKFTPVVGRILADLADGTGPAPELFSLARERVPDPAAPSPGRVARR